MRGTNSQRWGCKAAEAVKRQIGRLRMLFQTSYAGVRGVKCMVAILVKACEVRGVRAFERS